MTSSKIREVIVIGHDGFRVFTQKYYDLGKIFIFTY